MGNQMRVTSDEPRSWKAWSEFAENRAIGTRRQPQGSMTHCPTTQRTYQKVQHEQLRATNLSPPANRAPSGNNVGGSTSSTSADLQWSIELSTHHHPQIGLQKIQPPISPTSDAAQQMSFLPDQDRNTPPEPRKASPFTTPYPHPRGPSPPSRVWPQRWGPLDKEAAGNCKRRKIESLGA